MEAETLLFSKYGLRLSGVSLCLSRLWNLQMCDSSCEIAETEISLLIGQVGEIEEKIRLQLILLILRMQHCAIYSQMGAHEKALDTAQQNLQGLK